MNILILTSNYPDIDLPKSTTPVVHYFAKEWQKIGNNIIVIHNHTVFPKFIYKILRVFKNQLTNRVGYTFPTTYPNEKFYTLDNIKVYRNNMFKLFPHSAYTKNSYKIQISKIKEIIKDNNFYPDIIVGHWITPQLYLLFKLKQEYPKCTTVLSVHEELPVLERDYGEKGKLYLNKIDKLAFRSSRIKEVFLRKYNITVPTYMCYSGIPEQYISDVQFNKNISKTVTKFTFVGTLIKRKYPDCIIRALNNYNNKRFEINYIGEGSLNKKIKHLAQKYDITDNVAILGRLPREQVMNILNKTECFIMISKYETFGLVYLEAMANGCITIASRNEGMDGIIKHGVNGFLCEAGNWKELRKIIDYINTLSINEKLSISQRAIQTAIEMTDYKVANSYLNFISM